MEEVVTELKMPDLQAKSFIANGTEYFIAESISIERLRIKNRLDIAHGYGGDFGQVFKSVKAAYDKLNEQKTADASYELRKLMEGMVNVDEGEIGSVRLCTLFMNTLGEDVRYYNKAVMDKKIADWEKEGIDVNFFLLKAISGIAGFMPALNEHTPNSLSPTAAPEPEN